MATVTEQPRTRDLAESHRRVRHPLQRLRNYIRFYVAVEAVTVFLLFVALWFWVGLALDYGIFQGSRQEMFFRIFKSAPIDWVEFVPIAWRLVGFLLLLGGLIGVLAFMIHRLFRQFREDALALVLERRFPKLLGDRLITAVELADVRKAARYGYSQEMIELTIREAANRVDQVPLGEVFNWRRLVNQVIAIAVLFLGVYLVVGASATGIDFATHKDKATALGGFGRFHKVAGRWFERNAEPWTPREVCQWDRMAYLEVVDPAVDDFRVGLDSNVAPKIRVRAYRWVGANPNAKAGWSPLRWDDLAKPEYKALLGGDAPTLPAAITSQRPPETVWTVDLVELTLNGSPVQQRLVLQQVADRLDTIVAGHAELGHQKDDNGGIHFVIKEKEAAPEGDRWRALKWADLRVLDTTIPDVPQGWEPEVDAVVKRLEKEGVKDVPALKTGVLDRLEAATETGEKDRVVRKLTVPATVYVLAAGATTRNDMSLDKNADNEYTGIFQDLKETINFRVRGEDFFTPAKTITLVPPPGLEEIMSKQWRPAYAYYNVPVGATVEDFRNRKQVFPNRPLTMTGSESRVEIPAGSDIELVAKVDKPLCALPTEPKSANSDDRKKEEEAFETLKKKQPHIMPPRKGVAEVKADVTRVDDRHFRCEFKNVTTPLDFFFEFTDSDDVTGARHVKIIPQEDKSPDVDVNVEVIRKTTQGYIVTAKALIPFSGKLNDDHGLTAVEYAFTITRLDSSLENTDKTQRLLSALYQTLGGLGGDLPATAKLSLFLKDPKAVDVGGEQATLHSPLGTFVKKLQARNAADPKEPGYRRPWERDTPPWDKVQEWLDKDPFGPRGDKEPPHPAATAGRLLREFVVEPEDADCKLDLLRLENPLFVRDEREIQPRYKMQLWMEAVDNDLLTGPKRGVNKEKFTFLIVSENELLSEVGKEEENLHVKLDDMTNRLREGQSKLEKIINDLGSVGSPALKADQFAPASVRTEEMEQILDKSLETTKEVLTDYQRIIKELETNRVKDSYINKTRNSVVDPLTGISLPGGAFTDASSAMKDLHKILDNAELDLPARSDNSRKAATVARAKLEELIKQLDGVLAGMEGIITLNKLIDSIRKLEEEERAMAELLRILRDRKIKGVTDDLYKDTKEDPPKDKPKQP
jgi:hypothetical protein